jgi:hypothetical protein
VAALIEAGVQKKIKERKQMKRVFQALQSLCPNNLQKQVIRSVPMQKGVWRLTSTLELYQRKCLMNSMLSIKMAHYEEKLKRKWQEKTQKNRREIKSIKKDLEEKWLQVHQRELKGLEINGRIRASQNS